MSGEEPKSEENDTIVGGKFKLLNKIGEGSFGDIYFGKSVSGNKHVAIKIEKKTKYATQLLNEKSIYNYLAGGFGIANVHYFGCYNKCYVLVIDRLGPNLEELFVACHCRFSMKTVIQIFEQLLERLEYMHSKGIIHRDVKPHNFLIGHTDGTRSTIFISDFGLSKFYCDPKSKKHIKFREDKKLVGTVRYASINSHLGYEQSRRDDLEAVGYTAIYFAKGILPWQGLKANSKKQKYEKIAEKKLSISVEQLCKELPDEFVIYLNYIRNLLYDEDPDYDYLLSLFKNLHKILNYKRDNHYDWLDDKGKLRLKSEKEKKEKAKKEKQAAKVKKTKKVQDIKQTVTQN
ncbi:casein kinase I-like [Teleopsis dalmanni]|uniref:casein kinase I-like n=1 Tax=Teleopsis dalmanni TaxID=139649 RepID=UPI0018CCB475|nr:casein kinase I-like [Teleopsis dalmanni]XP_037935672.1 casein kinase I-like [Teleopsis dalmanni]